MSPPGLDVFPLRDFVLADYKEFATSFTTIHAESIDGVFTDRGDVEELLGILNDFEPKWARQAS